MYCIWYSSYQYLRSVSILSTGVLSVRSGHFSDQSTSILAGAPDLRGPSSDWEFSEDIWLGSVLGGMFSEFSVLLLSQLILNLVTLETRI